MQLLILAVFITFVYTISLLTAGQAKDGYSVFSLSIIAIITSGYFLNASSTILITSLCCLLALTLIYAGIPVYNILQLVILFIVSAFLAAGINKLLSKIINKSYNYAKIADEKLSKIKTEAASINSLKAQLENKVAKISDLYYSAKKLEMCLSFDELLAALRDIITESFKFKTCQLITVYNTDETAKIDRIYRIAQDKTGQAEGHGYEKGLLNVMLRRKQPLFMDARTDKPDAEEFVVPEGLNTFMAVPIIAAEKTNAVLAVEDIPFEQRDQFVVVVNQFSMALERIRLYELVQELAITDGLTGAFVRRHMLERLNEELDRADHFNTRVSLLMIDMDNFKDYNDKYGHLEGDILLKKTAAFLKGVIREIDIIGRYGGEEFCIILPDTDTKGAEYVARRLAESVRAVNVTLSIGIATYPEDAKNYATLIEKADKMLYKAKQTGKNKVCIYEK